MQRIASFEVDHTRLKEGVYVSRRDKYDNNCVTTYDIRMKKPNQGDYLSTTQMHTIEHLGATFFRNDERYKQRTVYFGPMGCRTGFYLLLSGENSSEEIFAGVKDMFEFIAGYDAEIPGKSERECGNYLDLELSCAVSAAKEFLLKAAAFTAENFNYPQ